MLLWWWWRVTCVGTAGLMCALQCVSRAPAGVRPAVRDADGSAVTMAQRVVCSMMRVTCECCNFSACVCHACCLSERARAWALSAPALLVVVVVVGVGVVVASRYFARALGL